MRITRIAGPFALIGLFAASASPLTAAPIARPIALATGSVQSAPLPPAPLDSIFHIEKSENKNQVHYGVHVDTHCRPLGSQPMYGYWRELEKGPRVISDLLSHELPAYGLTAPRSIASAAEGGEIHIGLRGFPERPLAVQTARFGSRCGARAFTTIQKQPAMLQS
ncbi:MAG TPA: DUF4833 domain-containing protein, partial [Polyangiales bacterium]|nr:DUF4833 domain-containing protein [Polyangiales bacterium]